MRAIDCDFRRNGLSKTGWNELQVILQNARSKCHAGAAEPAKGLATDGRDFV